MSYRKTEAKVYGSKDAKSRAAMFEQKGKKEQEDKQKANPFSQWRDGSSHLQKLNKKDDNYGKPVEGSKSDLRGKKAVENINDEIVTLCDIIWNHGLQDEEEGTACISFGDLFQIYTRISNKVVGILMRARKHRLLYFKGEMLYQGRDDGALVFLVEPISEIYKIAGRTFCPVASENNCHEAYKEGKVINDVDDYVEEYEADAAEAAEGDK